MFRGMMLEMLWKRQVNSEMSARQAMSRSHEVGPGRVWCSGEPLKSPEGVYYTTAELPR